jgi:hypothetical protein
MERDFTKAATQDQLRYRVGRTKEIDVFQRSLAGLIKGLNHNRRELIYRVLFLSGEGGIGKSQVLLAISV